MELQEQMLKMVADWFSSNQIKREFLKDKIVGEYKFNYWIRKYRDQSQQTKDFDEFKEIETSHFDRLNASPIVKNETSRKIEITTPSGFVITIVEEC